MKTFTRLNAELHLHLGGAILPRILYTRLERDHDSEILSDFNCYEDFEAVFNKKRNSLNEFLELHTFVEKMQTIDRLEYFIARLIRGAYLFENICYLELRHTPYLRTDPTRPDDIRIKNMRNVVETIATTAQSEALKYPLLLKQILCMHTNLSYKVNHAIVDLAADMRKDVCAIDIAGPDTKYNESKDDIIRLFQYARERGLKTTGHIFETKNGSFPELIPFLDRIGHGIQIPLHYEYLLPEIAERKQCLEVCPTSYLRTGTIKDLQELETVFTKCEDYGVDIVICTDNSGLNMVRLPNEYENLLINCIISFEKMQECRNAAFKHAFEWPFKDPLPSATDKLLSQYVEFQQQNR